MTNEELKHALKTKCPVVLENPDGTLYNYAFVSGIMTRYNSEASEYEISVEVTDYIENSVTICKPKSVSYWYPKNDSNKGEEQ